MDPTTQANLRTHGQTRGYLARNVYDYSPHVQAWVGEGQRRILHHRRDAQTTSSHSQGNAICNLQDQLARVHREAR